MGFSFWPWGALLTRLLVVSPSMAVSSAALLRAANGTVDTPASPQVVSRTRLLSESTATPFLRGSFPEDPSTPQRHFLLSGLSLPTVDQL